MAYVKKKSTEIKVEVVTHNADAPTEKNGDAIDIAELEEAIAASVRDLAERALQGIPAFENVKQVRITVTAEDN